MLQTVYIIKDSLMRRRLCGEVVLHGRRRICCSQLSIDSHLFVRGGGGLRGNIAMTFGIEQEAQLVLG